MASSETYQCGECGRTYGTIGHLNRHTRTHTGERPYKCDQCPKSYMRKDHLDDHSFSHTTERPFPCTQCEKKFYTKQKLYRHQTLHSRPKPYVCEDCNEGFIKKSQLARHRVQHTGKQPFPCPEPDCDKAFSVPSSLRRHQERQHSLSTYLCIEQGCVAEPFTKFSQLQRHLKQHRPTRAPECDKCGKRFRSTSSLSKHKPIHELPVPDRLIYKCQFPGCRASYTSSGNLGTHVRSRHLNRNAFFCNICTARFSVKSSYERHLRNLHGDGAKKAIVQFFCTDCDSVFSVRTALRRHLRTSHGLFTVRDDDDYSRASPKQSGADLCKEEKKEFVTENRKHFEQDRGSTTCGKPESDDLSHLERRNRANKLLATRKRNREAAQSHEGREKQQKGTEDNECDVDHLETQFHVKRQRFTPLLEDLTPSSSSMDLANACEPRKNSKVVARLLV